MCCDASTAVLNGAVNRRKGFVFAIINFLRLELKPQELTGEIFKAVIRRMMIVIKSDDCPVTQTIPGDCTIPSD